MKKHILRVLVVMLMACLGIGVLAACGGKEDPASETYTVAFSLGEGEANHAADGVTAPASQTGKKVGDTITLTAPEAEENWKFDGWSAKSGKVSGTTYTVKAADAVDGTITLTAQWAEDASAKVTVTYSLGSCGDTAYAGTTTLPASVTMNAGGTVTLPDKPVWNGYTFLGWKVGADTKAAKAEITVSESITVTATWADNTPKPATSIEGVWTTEADGVTTEVTIKLSEDKETAEAIIYTADQSDPDYPEYAIDYYTLTLSSGSYTYKLYSTSYTFTLADSQLTMTKVAPSQSGFGNETVTTTFTDGIQLPARGPVPYGTYKGASDITANLIHFNESRIIVSGAEYPFTTKVIGKYLVLVAEEYDDLEEETTYSYYFVYEDAGKEYILGGAFGVPAELTQDIAEYTITFKLGAHAAAGATVAAITAKEGDLIDLPTVATEAGYVLNAWSEKINANDTREYSITKKYQVTKDVELTAVIELIDYRLTFDKTKPADADPDSNIVGTIPPRVTVTTAEPDTLLPVLSLTGYVFQGWKMDGSNDVITSFTLTSEIIASLDGGTEIHFTPVWKKIEADEVSITFDKGTLDETVDETLKGMPTNTTATAGAYTIPDEEPTCDGYTFLGWKVTGDETIYKKGTDHASYTVGTEAVTFTAQWQKDTFTLTYDYGEGTDDPAKASEQVAWGTEVYYPATPAAKEGYKFNEWQAKANGEGYKLDGLYFNSFTMPRSNATLFATWTKIYDVHFDLGDHAAPGASVSDVTGKAAGSSVSLPTPQGAEGWEFDGWYKKGDVKVTTATYTVDVADLDAEGGLTITLTAHWKEASTTYTVAFSFGEDSHAKAGTQPPAQVTGKKLNGTVTLTDPEPADGWLFDGWYSKSGKVDGETYTVKAADADETTITLTAHWKKAPAPIGDYVGTWVNGQNTVSIAQDSDGTTLHAVIKTDKGGWVEYTYCALTAEGDGYTGEEFIQQKQVTISYDGETFSVKIGGGAATTYTKGTAEAISLEGTYKTEYGNRIIDFTEKTIDETDFDGDPIAVGEYLVFSTSINMGFGAPLKTIYIVYSDGEDYYIYYAELSNPYKLIKQGGGTDPQPTVNIEGLWTGDNIEITIDLDEGGKTGYAVIKTGTNYQYTALVKSGDGYTGTVNYMEVTFSIEGDSLKYSSGDVTLSARTELPAHIKFTGKWSMTTTSGEVKVDFDSKKIEVGSSYDFTEAVAGGYVVVYFKMSTYQDAGLYIYKDADKYYGVIPALELSTPTEFKSAGGTASTEDPQPQEIEYTVKFFAEKDSYESPFKTITVKEGTVIEEDDEYTDLGTPTKANYTFAGWKLKHNDTALEGATADSSIAEAGEEHIIIVYATWTLSKELDLGTITAGENWATTYWTYPEALKEGDVLTLTGTLTLTAAARWNGVYFNFAKGEDWANTAAFAYDWRINPEHPTFPYTNEAVEVLTDWVVDTQSETRNWSDDMSLMATAGYTHFDAKISYLSYNLIEIVYTLKSNFTPLNGTQGEHTLTMRYQIRGELEDIHFCLVGEKATLTNAHITRSTLAEIAEEIQDTQTVTQGVVVGTTTGDNYWGTEFYALDIKAGQKVTLTGEMHSAATENYHGVCATIRPYQAYWSDIFNFRFDNYLTAAVADGNWKQTYERYNFSIAKAFTRTYEGYGTDGTVNGNAQDETANGADYWTAFKTAMTDCDLTVTVDWSKNADEIVLTYAFTSKTTSGYSSVQTYTITPLKAGTHLAPVYTFTLKPDHCYVENPTVNVTYTDLNAD